MKQTSTSKTSATFNDEAPILTQQAFDSARFRLNNHDISRSQWQSAVRARIGKQRINIMLDVPIVAHFKALAGDRGYQMLINDTLRRVIETDHLEVDLRRVVREELAHHRES